ncbi:MAG: hypothetical protein ABIO29_03040 [Sphingomicrobium sp.]
MRKRTMFKALIAMIATLAAAATANAEPKLGSRLSSDHVRDTRAYPEELAAKTAHSLVVCLLAHDVKGATTLLTTGDKVAADKAYRSLLRWSVNNCNMLGDASPLSDQVGFAIPKDIFRGLVAERLVAKQLAALAAMPPLPVQMTYSRPWFPVSNREPVVNEMAVCLAETDPTGTAALFRTTAYSTQEVTAIQNLGPAMQKCLRVGVKLRANRQTLRAALAEGAFNRLIDPAASIVSPSVVPK